MPKGECKAGRLAWPAFLVATETVEFAAKPSPAAFFRRRPDPHAQGRLVADVLPVPAHQIGHPISVLVQMKSDDLLFHFILTHVSR